MPRLGRVNSQQRARNKNFRFFAALILFLASFAIFIALYIDRGREIRMGSRKIGLLSTTVRQTPHASQEPPLLYDDAYVPAASIQHAKGEVMRMTACPVPTAAQNAFA